MHELDELFANLKADLGDQAYPPVMQWSPERSGQIDIRIDADGTWYHEGREIRRQGLVKVFSSILRCDDGAYFLVTPVEKLAIQVEDVPFIGVDLHSQGAGEALNLILTTNVGDLVEIGAEHPLNMRDERPYVRVRDALEARINRATYYRLVEYGQEEAGVWTVYSNGCRFTLGATS